MARGRKHGCPINIRSWLVYVRDEAEDTYVRIYGLNSLTRTLSGETADGSADTELWQEPYVTKRSCEIQLEGETVEEEGTGERDRGQSILDEAALSGGCDTDITLKFVDPFGHAMVADFIVTGAEQSSDDTESGCSWTLEQIGEAETLPYIQVEGVQILAQGSSDGRLSLSGQDGARLAEVAFTPENASNRRFRVRSSRPGVCRIADVTENGFTLIPLSAGETSVRVTSVNGGRTATLAVTVA